MEQREEGEFNPVMPCIELILRRGGLLLSPLVYGVPIQCSMLLVICKNKRNLQFYAGEAFQAEIVIALQELNLRHYKRSPSYDKGHFRSHAHKYPFAFHLRERHAFDVLTSDNETATTVSFCYL